MFKALVESRDTPQKMRWRRRAMVVFPLDEGPDMPTIRAFGLSESVILSFSVDWRLGRGLCFCVRIEDGK